MRFRPLVLAFALAAAATTHPVADASKVRTYGQTRASERLGGRMTGTEGETLARQFIVSELRRIGARPLPGQKDFALPFEFTAGTRDGGSRVGFSITNPVRDGIVSGIVPGTGPGANARALSFSDN